MNNRKQVKQVLTRDYIIIKTLVVLSLLFFLGTLIGTIVMLLKPISGLNYIIEFFTLVAFASLFFLLFLIFLSWFLYVGSYKNIQKKMFQDKYSITLFITMKLTYVIVKWVTFGWWLTKKYNYKKEFNLN